jgi:hypothetical protein
VPEKRHTKRPESAYNVTWRPQKRHPHGLESAYNVTRTTGSLPSNVWVSNRERERDLSLLSDVWVVPSAGGRARRYCCQMAKPMPIPEPAGER